MQLDNDFLNGRLISGRRLEQSFPEHIASAHWSAADNANLTRELSLSNISGLLDAFWSALSAARFDQVRR
jgi:hypothetical protein